MANKQELIGWLKLRIEKTQAEAAGKRAKAQEKALEIDRNVWDHRTKTPYELRREARFLDGMVQMAMEVCNGVETGEAPMFPDEVGLVEPMPAVSLKPKPIAFDVKDLASQLDLIGRMMNVYEEEELASIDDRKNADAIVHFLSDVLGQGLLTDSVELKAS